MDGGEWLEAHRAAIEATIASESEQAALAHRLIPRESVAPATRSVSIDQLNYETGTVDDQTQVDIERPRQVVEIPTLQTDDSDPARALVAIRRAAQQLARQHDERVLRTELGNQIEGAPEGDPQFQPIVDITPVNGSIGEGVVVAVADALQRLDDDGYRTGYALVASASIWTELHRLSGGSSTLPIQAVRAVMDDGPVHRSARLKNGDALLLSLGEGRIDRVVAESPKLAFIDQDANVRRFELYERFVPRFRETRSAALLRLNANGGGNGDGES